MKYDWGLPIPREDPVPDGAEPRICGLQDRHQQREQSIRELKRKLAALEAEKGE